MESQPKQMPITTMENITLTDTREIESSLIGGEMAKKIKKMLTQQQQIENRACPTPSWPQAQVEV